MIETRLANRHEHREFLIPYHYSWGSPLFPQIAPFKGHSKGWRIPLKIGGDILEHTLILRELTVLSFNFLQLLFSGAYLVWVPKCCFQELYRSLLVFQPYCSVLPEVWTDLVQSDTPQAVRCIPHLWMFIGKAGRLMLNYHLQSSNPATYLCSIWSWIFRGVGKFLASVFQSQGSSQRHPGCWCHRIG